MSRITDPISNSKAAAKKHVGIKTLTPSVSFMAILGQARCMHFASVSTGRLTIEAKPQVVLARFRMLLEACHVFFHRATRLLTDGMIAWKPSRDQQYDCPVVAQMCQF